MSGKGQSLNSGLKHASMEVRRHIPRSLRTHLRHGAVDVDHLVENAQVALDNLELESARQFVDKALKIDRRHARGLELKALLYLEDGKPMEARKLLLRAVEVDPDNGYSKYMYLGQIEAGEEAAQFYGKGIEVMAAEAEDLHEEGNLEQLADMNHNISIAFCSLAELYLTDLCDVDDAEVSCRTLLEKALQYDECNVQALQSMGSYFISMQESETALEFVRKSVAIWFKAKEEEVDLDAVEAEAAEEEESTAQPTPKAENGMAVDDDEYEDVDEEALADQEPPPYEFRISAAKLLIELSDTHLASQILEQLIEEDEEVMQVWYLLGWSAHLQEDVDQALEALHKAKDLFKANECEDEEVLHHIEELLQSYPQNQVQAAAGEL